jgi:hypothetical protein
MPHPARQRLTSWKDIAAHLGRDVRTVMRWEKERGLPIHRLPGRTSRALFAYVDEIDAWSRGASTPETPVTQPQTSEAEITQPVPVPVQVPETAAPPGARPWLAVAAIVAVVTIGAWSMGTSRADERSLSVRVAAEAVEATRPDGTMAWRHPFGSGLRAVPIPSEGFGVTPLSPAGLGTLAATSYMGGRPRGTAESGRLFWFAPDGRLQRTFTPDDRVAFTSGTYDSPWAVTDYSVDDASGTPRIAIASHHFQWWPSVVTVLDATLKRSGTFVNAGWVERVQWTDRDQLLISGFSNAFDGGMVAMLDTRTLDGQSPTDAGSQYHCTTCGAGRPERYVVLPRSEVNRAASARFNRVSLEVYEGRIVAHSIEMPEERPIGAADAIYEFTPALELIRSSYSDRYWEVHGLLEAEGKIKHTRAQCPERDGPSAIRVWEPGTGWTTRARVESPR